MKKLAVLALTSIVALVSGCATIVDGDSETLTFNSIPSGAEIYVNGDFKGNTPLTVRVAKSRDTLIEARKEGYHPNIASPSRSINPIFFGNVLSGYFSTTGMSVDVATNSAYKFDQNQWLFNMQPDDKKNPSTSMNAQQEK